MITDKQIEDIVKASEEHLKEVEGFSATDVKIATRMIGAIILILWLNDFPIMAKKFPAVLRVIANALEQIGELKRKGDD